MISYSQEIQQTPNRYLIYTSKWKLAWSFIFFSIFIAIMILAYLDDQPESDILFWAVTAFFMWGGLFYIKIRSSTQLQITITSEGIKNVFWNNSFVPWDDIYSIKLKYRYRLGYDINIELKDCTKYRSQLPRRFFFFNNLKMASGMGLNFFGLDKSAEQAWQYICSLESAQQAIQRGR